jgi:hypothetical protein
LQGGLKVTELGGNNQESQFLEARRFQVEEVCRIFSVPPHLVGDLTRSSFSNIEQMSLEWLTNGLTPWLRRIESSITRDLLEGDDEYFAEFDTRGMMRADAAGRSAFYQSLWNLGVASVNEIRAWENLNPVEGGDTRFVQLNMTTLEKAAAAPEPMPATVVEEIVVDETAPAPEPVAEAAPAEAEDGPQIADVSLNGAQVSSLLEIVAQYNAGLLNEQGAKAIIAAAFPGIPASTVNAIIAGTNTEPVVMPDQPGQREAQPVAASLPASRAMTISVDFDRTFSADPRLWGEFARKAVADGNRVVMISRRPEADREVVVSSLGDYAEAFSDVLLVGSDTLKDDAAQAAGIDVDVWVDDSPQFIRSESRAAPGSVAEGDFVSWDSSGGRARGRIDHVMDYGTLDIPGTDFKIDATEEDPAALITVYEEVSGGWRATETQVGHKVSTLTKIEPLPEPPPVEESSYGKPKRKGRKRG